MAIEVVVPVQRTARRDQPDRPILNQSEEVIVGLIANGKFGSEILLDHLGQELVRSGFAGNYLLWKKPTASRSVTESERDRMLARCNMVISGVGD